MPDITDAETIRFMNQQIRPMAEKVRNIKVEIDDLLTKWNDVIRPKLQPIHSNPDIIDDGRAVNGVSVVSFVDLKDFADDALTALQTELNAGLTRNTSLPRMDAVRKPTVRPLRVEGS